MKSQSEFSIYLLSIRPAWCSAREPITNIIIFSSVNLNFGNISIMQFPHIIGITLNDRNYLIRDFFCIRVIDTMGIFKTNTVIRLLISKAINLFKLGTSNAYRFIRLIGHRSVIPHMFSSCLCRVIVTRIFRVVHHFCNILKIIYRCLPYPNDAKMDSRPERCHHNH
ncbi:hypothetical protein [Escherichia phage AnYang]|uniref:Uncharacterized protein n=1 Tax=Escherichia phage AnYang TaxID=2499909 RepID=A0A410T4H9_9CAUD|nr:hypothetical protein KNU29_gp065 [Escherichia phage AnYang]QAU03600.1 hypothetical protein [Escherichia phage AnYang]